MDLLPLNSPSLNTLLRSVGIRDDSHIQKNMDDNNFSSNYSDELAKVTSEKYEPGQNNYSQREASYITLVQPQFQSNTPISKKNGIRKTFLEKLKPAENQEKVSNSTNDNNEIKSAQIYSSNSEEIGTGYFASVQSSNVVTTNKNSYQNNNEIKFNAYLDRSNLKGSLLNIRL